MIYALNVLTSKQAKFVAEYVVTLNATKSAISAGYSANSAHVEANRLLKLPKIVAEIDSYKIKKRASLISKPDYIDTVWHEYETSEEKADRFRGLDLAGRALGFVGVHAEQRPNQSLTINVTASGNESPADLWALTRKLLSSND